MERPGTQLDKYRFTSHPTRNTQEYTLWKRQPPLTEGGPGRWGDVGYMQVARDPGYPDIALPDAEGYATRRPSSQVPGNYNENWMMATRDPALFMDFSEPPTNTVELMQFHKKDRAMAPTMLGIANLESIRDTGTGLIPSTDLSDHSDRMVNKLASRGAVDDWDGRYESNDMDFMTQSPLGVNEDVFERHWSQYQVPQENVNAGKQMVRNILRGKKPGGQLTEYVQESLF